MRNDRAHRQATRVDPGRDAALLERFRPVVEALVGRLYPPGAFLLLRAEEGALQSAARLHGPRLEFAPEPARPGWAAALGATGLAAAVGERALPVYPLLVPDADLAPSSPKEPEPALLLEAVRPKRLSLLGVRCHGSSVPHLAAFQAAVARKRVDFGLGREGTTPWALAAWSGATAAEELSSLLGRKYLPACYIPRAGVDDLAERCLEAPGRALLLLGEAGAGKSSLCCRLVDGLLSAGEAREREGGADVVLFLSGRAAFAGDAGLTADRLLADAVARRAGVHEGAFPDLGALVARLAESAPSDTAADRRTWLVLDALNEAERFGDLVGALDRFLPDLARHPWLRLVLSMRAGAYRSLERRGQALGDAGGVFANERHLQAFLDTRERREVPYLSLRPFDEGEGERAYRRRQEALPERACPVQRAQLDPALRALLCSPLHLHVFHETFRGVARPPQALDEARLFAAHLAALEAELPVLREALASMGRELFDRRRPDLPTEVADAWVEAWRGPLVAQHGIAAVAARLDPIEALVSASILLRPALEGFGCDRRLVAYYLRPPGALRAGAAAGAFAPPGAARPARAGRSAGLGRGGREGRGAGTLRGAGGGAADPGGALCRGRGRRPPGRAPRPRGRADPHGAARGRRVRAGAGMGHGGGGQPGGAGRTRGAGGGGPFEHPTG
ncbi:MAG: hypothetical protein ABIO70_06605 [Pseudomonadota bacterium]